MVAQRSTSILLLPLYTRYLSRADYGAMELLDLVPNIAGLLVGLRLSQALFYFYHHAQDESDRKRYVTTAFAGAALIGLVVGALGLACASPISHLVLGSARYSYFVQVTFLSFAASLPVEVGFSYLRVQDRVRTYAVASVWRIAGNVLLNVLFLTVLGMGISALLWSSVITTGGLAIYFGCMILRTTAPAPSWHVFARMARYSIPLAVSAFGEFLLHFGDRLFLRNGVPLDDLGLYGLAYKLGMVVPFLIVPFFSYWNAQMVGIVARPGGDSVYARTATYFLLVLASLTLLLTAFADPILSLLADPEFRGASVFIPWIALAYAIRGMASYWSNTFLLVRRSGLVAMTTWAGSGACLLAYAVLIPRYGLWGAVAGTLLGFTIMAAAAFWKSQQIRPFHYEYVRWAKIVGCAVVSALPVLLLHPSGFWMKLVLGTAAFGSFIALLHLVGVATVREREFAREALSRLRLV